MTGALLLTAVLAAAGSPRTGGDFALGSLLLERAVLPEAGPLATACARRWGEALPVTPSDEPLSSLPPGTTRALTLAFPQGEVVVALRPDPVSTAEAAPFRSADKVGWDALPDHQAALAVFVFTYQGAVDDIERHLLLTRALVCLAESTPSVAVNMRGHVTSRKRLLEIARNLSREAPPVSMWVGVLPVKGKPGRPLATTFGLARLRRLEMVATGAEAASLLRELLPQVVREGDFADGAVVRRPDGTVLKARHAPSPVLAETTVVWIDRTTDPGRR